MYDTAKTPYQRLIATEVLSLQQKEALAQLYHSLNPVQLLAQINKALEQLWDLAE